MRMSGNDLFEQSLQKKNSQCKRKINKHVVFYMQ